MKKERDCKIRWSFSISSNRWNNGGKGRLFFFFLIRRENSFLLPFFVAVYRCSLQSHDHEFNRARWLAQSSFPGCLPEERLFNNWNTRKKQLLPKLHRATVPFHAPLKIFETRYTDEAIKTISATLGLFYLLDRGPFHLLLIIFDQNQK